MENLAGEQLHNTTSNALRYDRLLANPTTVPISRKTDLHKDPPGDRYAGDPRRPSNRGQSTRGKRDCEVRSITDTRQASHAVHWDQTATSGSTSGVGPSPGVNEVR